MRLFFNFNNVIISFVKKFPQMILSVKNISYKIFRKIVIFANLFHQIILIVKLIIRQIQYTKLFNVKLAFNKFAGNQNLK